MVYYTVRMDELTMVRHLENFFAQQGFLTKKEVSAGYGRADLVLVKLNGKKCKVRKDHKQSVPLLKEKFFQVLRQLPDIKNKNSNPLSFEELISRVSVSKNYLKYFLLPELEKNGYIKKIDDKYFYKVNGWVPLAKEVVAIEAKLSSWRQGFIQANRYTSFADKSYLALPFNKGHLVDKALLRKHNIGLYLLSENNKLVTEAIRPINKTRATEDKRNFVTEFYLNEVFNSV